MEDVGIGPANGTENNLVADRPAVDKGELVQRIRAIEGGQADQAGQPRAFALGIDFDGIVEKRFAEHLTDPGSAGAGRFQVRPRGRQVDARTVRTGQNETFVRMRQRQGLDGFGNRRGFGPFGFEELQACRGGKEKVAHDDLRSAAQGRRFRFGFAAALNRNGPGVGLVSMPALDGQIGDGSDRGQRLAAKSKRMDCHNIGFVEF